MAKWWWPFGGREEAEAESHFHEMLREATLNHEDLKRATEDMRRERLRRLGGRESHPELT